MQAVALEKSGGVSEHLSVTSVAKPSIREKDLLVKICCAALNPVDWKMAKSGLFIQTWPCVLGCDMSGIVEEVGSKVTAFKKGDPVHGFTHLGTFGAGTFAEYCIIQEGMAAKKPDNLSFEQAATLPLASLTAFMTLFDAFKFPLPSSGQSFEEKEYLLVWGASSSVGQCVVQLAKSIGLHVIGVCSKHNQEFVSKEFGANCLVDYKEKDVVNKILKETEGNLHYAVDCVGTETANLCLQCLTKFEIAHLVTIAGGPSVEKPKTVKHDAVNVAHIWNEPAKLDFAHKSYVPLLEKGTLKPNNVQLLEGLDSVPKGLEMLSQNQVSGKKLVVRVSPPPASVSE